MCLYSILIDKQLPFKYIETSFDCRGQYILVYCKTFNVPLPLMVIYISPSASSSLFKEICTKISLFPKYMTLLLGDINAILEPTLNRFWLICVMAMAILTFGGGSFPLKERTPASPKCIELCLIWIHKLTKLRTGTVCLEPAHSSLKAQEHTSIPAKQNGSWNWCPPPIPLS